jgi:LmbE family N-acetylglucosaminyl deacetylase
MSVLVVASHPDDEVLGCGGTIMRHVRNDERVTVAILGEGVTSRQPTVRETSIQSLSDLRDAAREAAARLGVTDLRLFDYPDNRFDTVELLDLVRTVEEIITDVRPHTVYCQHGGDLNIDHQLTFRAVLTATRPQPGQAANKLYTWSTRSATEWAFGSISPVFVPRLFVDISSTLQDKLEALCVYGSELRPWPHSRSLQAIEAACRSNGAKVGLEAVEVFDVIRIID